MSWLILFYIILGVAGLFFWIFKNDGIEKGKGV